MNYLVFLRGINVGGVKVSMSDLKTVLAKLDTNYVKTYLQTGNISLQTNLNEVDLKSQLEDLLSSRFNYQAYVLVFTKADLEEIVKAYPFNPNPDKHDYMLLTQDDQTAKELYSLSSQINKSKETIASGHRVVYWQVSKGNTLASDYAKIIARPKYKSLTTNRNLNTLKKMLAD